MKSFGKGMFGCFGAFVGGIIIIVAICVFAFGGSEDNESTKITSESTNEVMTKDTSNNILSSTSEVTTQNSQDNILSHEYHVGDTVSYKGYEIKVNSVNYSNGSEFDTPDTGKQYIIMNVTITNNTGKKQSYNPLDFKLNANGNATDADEFVSDDIATDLLNSGDLDNGASVTANLVGQADPNAKLKLQYETSIWNDETVDISLN